MWNIAMLKDNAKRVLKSYYWVAVLASFIVLSLTANLLSNLNQSDPVDVSSLMNSTGSGYSGSTGSGASGSYTEEDFDKMMEDIFGAGGAGSPSSSPSSGADDAFMDAFKKGFEASSGMDFDKVFKDAFNGIDMSDINSVISAILGVVVVLVIVSVIIRTLYKFLFANLLTVGHNRFYLDARMGGPGVMRIFSQFQNGAFANTAKTMFMYDFKLWLWGLIAVVPMILYIAFVVGQLGSDRYGSAGDVVKLIGALAGYIMLGILIYLLCMIPKMIKTYSYFLVPYLIAENPRLSTKRAFEISVKTMDGEKAHFFGLTLSFIGWYLLVGVAASMLGAFSGVIKGIVMVAGTAALSPYIYATYAEFYCCMREKAAATGIAYPDELCGGFGAEAAGIPYPSQPADVNMPYQRVDTSSTSTGSYPAYPGSGKMDTVNIPDNPVPQEPLGGYGGSSAGMDSISLEKHETGESDPDDPLG